MTKQTIGIGSTANDGTGDPLRTAFDKCNDNFNELYGSEVVTPKPIGLVWSEDFTGASYDSAVIKQFFATLTHDTANDRLTLTGTNPAIYLDQAALGLVDGDYYLVVANVTLNTADLLEGISAWGDTNQPRQTFADPNTAEFVFLVRKVAGTGSNYSPVIMARAADGASVTCYINSISVYTTQPVPGLQGRESSLIIGHSVRIGGAKANDIIIGNDIIANCTSTNDKMVLIGPDISATGECDSSVCIGADANISFVGVLAGTTDSNQKTAIGNNSSAESFRATAIGAWAQAACTSATAMGAGACTEKTHGDVFGRGGYIPAEVPEQSITVMANYDLYLGNGLFHRCDPSRASTGAGMTITEDSGSGVTPNTTECRIHGKDAFDARATPSLINVDGGHMAVCGGKGTGTGVGGDVRLQTAPAGSSGATKNSLVTAVEIDAVATGGSEETRFLLLDLTDGTLKRVSFGADHSAGTGFKVLRVAN